MAGGDYSPNGFSLEPSLWHKMIQKNDQLHEYETCCRTLHQFLWSLYRTARPSRIQLIGLLWVCCMRLFNKFAVCVCCWLNVCLCNRFAVCVWSGCVLCVYVKTLQTTNSLYKYGVIVLITHPFILPVHFIRNIRKTKYNTLSCNKHSNNSHSTCSVLICHVDISSRNK